MITGRVAPAPRRCRSTSKPDMSGRPISSTIRSKSPPLAPSVIPSAPPVPTVVEATPSASRPLAMKEAMSSSSSTIRILGMDRVLLGFGFGLSGVGVRKVHPRQGQRNCCPVSGFGFEEKFSVMSLSNRLDDRQAQTGSLDSHRSVADRAPADRVELVGGDAPPALVANPDVDLIADPRAPPG